MLSSVRPTRRFLFKTVPTVVGLSVAILVATASPAAADPLGDLVDDLAQYILDWVLRFARDDIFNMLNALNDNSEPDIMSAWFRGEYGVTLHLAVYLTLPVLMIATISAVARGGLGQVVRIYLIGLPISILGGVAAIAVVSMCIKIDNLLCAAMVTVMDDTFGKWIDGFEATSQGASDLVSALFVAAIVGLVEIGVVILWLELIFRNIMIFMALLFVPLAFAMYSWAATRTWLIALLEIILTVIFSKFVMMGSLTFGFICVLFASGEGGAGFGRLIMGFVVIFFSTIATPALIAFVLAPTHQTISRKQFMAATPMNADRRYVRQEAAKGAKGIMAAVGKGFGIK